MKDCSPCTLKAETGNDLNVLCSVLDPEPDPDSGAFWIRIRNPDPVAYKKKCEKLNNYKIMQLFTTFYLSIDFL